MALSFYAVVALVVVFVALVWWRGSRLLLALIHPMIERGSLSFFEGYPIGPDDVVFLGDSIMAGGQWEEIVPGAGIRNRGIGGDRTKHVLKRLGQVTRGTPRKLFLLIGTNDLATGVSQERIVGNIESVLDRVRDASPETRVYLHELFPRKATFRDRVVSLNAEILRLAEKRGLPLVRVFERFADECGAIRPELTYDDLHLSGPGYRAWGDALAPHLRD